MFWKRRPKVKSGASEPLPVFRYHPDPVATGMIEQSDTKCVCCGRRRGWVYTGPVYSVEEYDECICPWCIADGSAHRKLDADFTDGSGVGGYGDWDNVPRGVIDCVSERTPGFSGWQQERWWTHCGDAAAFVGRVGKAELDRAGPQAMEGIREASGASAERWFEVYVHLHRDGSPSAYLFRCLHCGKYGGYWDCD